MFGIDAIDLVPAGTIEDMVRENGPGLMDSLMQLSRNNYQLEEGERMAWQFMETAHKGKETILLLPLVLHADTLQTKRKLPFFDVNEFLATAPIADWVSQGKKAKKALDKMEPLLKRMLEASERGDIDKVEAIAAKAEEILQSLPPMAQRLLTRMIAPPAPAAPAKLGASAPATGTNDTETAYQDAE